MTRTQAESELEPLLALAKGVEVDEPPRPGRIRSQSNLFRALACLAGLVMVLLLPSIASQTTSGIQGDISEGTQNVHFLLSLASQLSTFWVLLVPVIFALDRAFRRDALRVIVGLLAAIIALGLTIALDAWASAAGPGTLTNALGWNNAGTTPLHADLTPVIAFVTAVRLAGRPRWQLVMWGTIALASLAALAAGYTTALGLVATYFIGRIVGYLTLYGIGTPNPRPPGTAVVAALERLGLKPSHALRIDDGTDDHRRYTVEAEGGKLDVTVLDRDQQTSGLLYRIWRGLRLRANQPRRALRSLRRSLEQESLMAYAAGAAQVRTPRLIATSEVGTEAALLAYEHVDGVRLADMPAEAITDTLLVDIWREVDLLHRQRMAHRSLDTTSIMVHGGVPYVVGLARGEIAVSDLLLRLDQAQLLTSLALRVGQERAVRTAAEVIGSQTLGAILPLLQKVALSRDTRTELRQQKDLLSNLREEILRFTPEVEIQAVRLERFRPRTIVSIVGLTIGTYFLLSQLSNVNLTQIITSAKWGWAIVALIAACVTYVAAAMMLIGFVPERLSWWRTILAQLAASFVKLVAPAAVTGVAINTRFLQRAGVRPGSAVASVGASQLTGMVIHIGLLIVFGFLTGSQSTTTEFAPSKTIVIVLLAGAAVAGALATIGRVRRLVAVRLKDMFSGVVPRLLDVLQDPRKVATGIGGTLLLTVAFVVCLDASIRAFGGSLSWTAVAVVFLTGNALGSAAPTPGGLGAVEGALTLGLTLAGLPAEQATSAVLLFRLLTFWLPVLPGWAAFTHLQRREAL
ncbi:flippase-like domain-containing protein [Actinocorallia longicatena]|uniref:Lysylphosphatidylglycerol synthase domain-containing protein n=1 Tax=Actinocorallia longicatena TaxID=111803 RepID=A0ABP6PVA3_9ACTN